jgi:hypothetical protein
MGSSWCITAPAEWCRRSRGRRSNNRPRLFWTQLSRGRIILSILLRFCFSRSVVAKNRKSDLLDSWPACFRRVCAGTCRRPGRVFRGVCLSAKEIILPSRTPGKTYCASGSPGYCGALFSGQQHFELFSIARRRKTSVAGTDECERFVFWQVREGFAKRKWQ